MLEDLVHRLRESRGLAHKRDIESVVNRLALIAPDRSAIAVGDDCAAIPDGDGFLLFAIEGFMNEFVAVEPWFAGYCGVMVNVSDIAAMGGRPLAVVDALWSDGDANAAPVLDGLAQASKVYGVPVVGGHSNMRSDRGQLSVAIVGRARKLLTSFDAEPGDRLVVAIDLRGHYHEPHSHWDASTDAPSARLRADLDILPGLAEEGLCKAAKDISMAGTVGTALMLMECSGVGGMIDVAAVPRPSGVAMDRWLTSFPSFGFVLAVKDADLEQVLSRFADRDIAAASVGAVDDSRRVLLCDGGRSVEFWNLDQSALIGCEPLREAMSV